MVTIFLRWYIIIAIVLFIIMMCTSSGTSDTSSDMFAMALIWPLIVVGLLFVLLLMPIVFCVEKIKKIKENRKNRRIYESKRVNDR